MTFPMRCHLLLCLMTFVRRSSSLSCPHTSLPHGPFSSLSLHVLLNACKSHKNLPQIHACIILKGAEQNNLFITKFVCLCNSFSNIRYASSVFERVDEPDIYLWNSIIKGCSENSILSDTITYFKRMKVSRTAPDCYTFPSLLKACSNALALREGVAMHCTVVRLGLASDVFVGTGLIDLYGKCKEIGSARKVFDGMSERNAVSWTAMIFGYANFGDLESARNLFDEMPKRNLATWNVMIDAYMKCGDLRSARLLFDAMPERNVVSFTSLIDGYAKAGDMASARDLFDMSSERDLFSWSALISGYAQNGRPNEAVKVFQEMCSKDIKPDECIAVSLMSACSQLGSQDLAKWVDSFLSQSGIDLNMPHVIAALIDMSAKCGNMNRALDLFEKMPKRDLFMYCSVIQGLSIHGCGVKAVSLFYRMIEEGITPDEVVFTVVLAACCHAGLVEDGCQFFNSMKNDYSITPSSDHYTCMVHLLGRSGRIKEAYELLRSASMEPNAGAWGALLGACSLHADVELGKIVAHHLFEIEPTNAGNYVLLSNIYADANQWSEVWKVRSMMRERGVKKIPGCSWI